MAFLFPLLFVAAMLTLASAILSAIYFLLRDAQPQRDDSKERSLWSPHSDN
jgi:hypothetical protein